MRYVAIHLLAPCARHRFTSLAHSLRLDTRFRIFETYRDPARQEEAFNRGTSKARAFESAHQFGLAADFVPWDGTKFVWPGAADPEWDELHGAAHRAGLLNIIRWDRAHVEHPSWTRVRTLIL
jgi:hypothetical protein